MQVFKYLQNRQLGAGFAKPKFDFVLDRLQCSNDDVFKIPSHQDSNSVPPFQSRFCPADGQNHIYSLASEEGNILILNSERPASQSLLREWTAHENAIFDTCWVGHNKIITASGDKTAVLWDVKTSEKLITCKGHGCSLKSIALQPLSDSVFATGARDGNIMLWDVRCRSLDGITTPMFTINEAHDAKSVQNILKQRKKRILQNASRIINPLNSITSVLFQEDNILLSTGSSDRTIKRWDLRFLSKVLLVPVKVDYPGSCTGPYGYTNLALHPNGSSFFANCTDGIIYRYTCNNKMPQLVSTYYGHKVNSFFIKMDLSGDGDYILSGSSDHKAYIWNVSKPGPPIVQLSGHEAEVTAVAWCPSEFTKVITCSDDDRVLQWRLGSNLEKKQSENSICSTIGEASPFDLKGFICPRQALKTPSSKDVTTLNSLPITPVTPSTSLKRTLNSPSLMQWFTPKRSANNTRLTPPTTPESCATISSTPVKLTRPVLTEFGQKNNSLNQENFQLMKKRLMEEQRLKAISLTPRRTLILDDKNNITDEKIEVGNENCSHLNTPSTSMGKMKKSPRKARKDNQKPYTRHTPRGIERFFTASSNRKI